MNKFLERPLFGLYGPTAVFFRLWSYSIVSIPIGIGLFSLLSAIYGEDVVGAVSYSIPIEYFLSNLYAPVSLLTFLLELFLVFLALAFIEEVMFRGWLIPGKVKFVTISILALFFFDTLLLILGTFIIPSHFNEVLIQNSKVVLLLTSIGLFVFGLSCSLRWKAKRRYLESLNRQFLITVLFSSAICAIFHLLSFSEINMPMIFWPLLVLSQFIGSICFSLVRIRLGVLMATIMHCADNVGIFLFEKMILLEHPFHLLSLSFLGIIGLATASVVKDLFYLRAHKVGKVKS